MSENQIGEFLAALRKSKGYTQQEVAERLGVSNKTVSSWETGASCPDISVIPVIAELYEVTCDEILRGRRLSSDGEERGGAAKRDRALRHILRRQRTNLATVCCISGGLTACGVILTLLVGYAALESLIGFFVGTIFLVASVLTCAVAVQRIRLSLGDECLCEEAERLSASLGRALLWVSCANVAAFAFILPHVFAPVHTGLTFGLSWIGVQLICGAVGLLVALLAGIPIELHYRKKSISRAVAETSPSADAVRSRAISANALARWRYSRILLAIILPVFIIEGVAIWLGVSASSTEIVWPAGTYTFIDADALSDLGGPFSDGEYSLVYEEQPQDKSETGRYEVRYLFKNFPERWEDYYLTEHTADGTIVTIYKYRYEATIDGVAEIYEFYAYNPEWQGGITEIVAEARTYQDEDGATFVSVIVRLDIAPTLKEQRDVEELVFRADVLGWSGFAVGMVGVIYLAVAIPLTVRGERAFRKKISA